MNESERQIEALFEAALKLPPDQRSAYLDRVCEGNATLRKRVEDLLAALALAGNFLKSPTEVIQLKRTVPSLPIVPVEKPGDRIGHYKLLEQIGEGGCGVVYMAEQTEPVRRRVALKVIKLGMDTKQVIARFEAERQALALMDHTNIAKVLDAGTTQTGRPFFVMELVRGVKITAFCDQQKLSTEARLKLFIQVCQAVQHAHQKGIIHRDLKPSNILVTINDDVPVPKVIDFGVAKATGGQVLTDKTVFTAFEQFIGTPAYMSPEQALMTSVDIDTRSDIYSLGVLLYELLTGSPPFLEEKLLERGMEEMLRTLREVEPPRPSTRLSSLDAAALTTTAQQRHTEPPKLIHVISGDLDWIVMKCLEKDRKRRYETANGLAADLLRHLNDEPIVARPPSKLYEFQKTVRRHKFGFAAAAALIFVLMVGVAISTWQAIRATHAEREQVQLRKQADASKFLANQQERIANQNQHIAQNQEMLARRRFYAAQMNLAMSAWESGRFDRAADLLETQRPEPGQPDLRRFEWYHLWRLSHARLKMTIGGHGAQIWTLSFSPDSKRIAAGHWREGAVRVRCVENGQLQSMMWCKSYVEGVNFTPDGRNLVAVGREQQATLWDAVTSETKLRFKLGGWVRAFAVSHDGKWLATAAVNEAIKLWNLKSGTLINSSSIKGTPVTMSFSPDDKVIYVGLDWGGGEKPTFTELESRSNQWPRVVLISPIRSLAISSNGRRIATSSSASIDIWDSQANAIGKLTGHLPYIWGLVWASDNDNETIYSISADRSIRRWDLKSGEPNAVKSTIIGVHEAVGTSVALSPDGSTLATGDGNGAVRLWDCAQTDEEVTRLSAMPFRVDSRRGSAVLSLLPAPDGKAVYVSTGIKGTCRYNLATGEAEVDFPEASGRGALSPDGGRLVTGYYDGSIRLWDTSNQKMLGTVSPHNQSPQPVSLSFSPNGGKLFSGGSQSDRIIRAWKTATELKQALAIDIGRGAGINAVACSPDGRTLAVASRHQTVNLRNPENLELRSSFGVPGGTCEIYALAFSPDSKALAVAGETGVINLFDCETTKMLRVFQGHASFIKAVAFSPDGETLASGGNDRTLRLWDFYTGQEKFSLTQSNEITALAFTPDGETLLVGDRGGGVVALKGSPLPQCEQLGLRVSGQARKLNAEAWSLATHVDPAKRDGMKAVQLAEEAVALTEREEHAFLDTLAAAYAETGDYLRAIKVQKEAMALAPTDWVQKHYEPRLNLYQRNSPYREPTDPSPQ